MVQSEHCQYIRLCIYTCIYRTHVLHIPTNLCAMQSFYIALQLKSRTKEAELKCCTMAMKAAGIQKCQWKSSETENYKWNWTWPASWSAANGRVQFREWLAVNWSVQFREQLACESLASSPSPSGGGAGEVAMRLQTRVLRQTQVCLATEETPSMQLEH